jgi:hypothetical protein
MPSLPSRTCCTRMSRTLMRCERTSTARMIRTSGFFALERHSTVGTDLVRLAAACTPACAALRALCLACCGLHGTLAARTCRSLTHPVSSLQVLHHRSHSSAGTCATRAGKLGHYIQGTDLNASYLRLRLANSILCCRTINAPMFSTVFWNCISKTIRGFRYAVF